MMNKSKNKQRGFTLVEMVMVIVITGIIGGMVAMFIKAPVQGYVDSARRAEMTDIADTALRRMSRDLRLALPNSVRVSADGLRLEFIPTTGGGRFRTAAAPSGAAAGCADLTDDVLEFEKTNETCFEVVGSMPAITGTESIVVYNLGIAGASAYDGSNLSKVTAVPAAREIKFNSKKFPFDSPAHRFQVITTPVTYVCSPVAGGGSTGTLARWQGYALATPATTQPPVTLPAGGTSALLATNVSGCSFSYDANVVAQRAGLVTMNLSITQGGEMITLYSATHVSNMP